MNFLTFLHFFSFFTFFYLIIFVLIKNPKAPLNQACAILISSFCIWSFSLIFVHSPYATKNTAHVFYSIGSFGWASFASCALYFTLVFSENIEILRAKLLRTILLGFPLILIYKQWTWVLPADYIKKSWGWVYVWSNSNWSYLFYFYYFLFMGIVFYILFCLRKRTKDSLKKIQATIFLNTVIISLGMASLTDVILPRLNIYIIPNIAPSFVLIWAFGLVYAIVKYRLLSITPVTAADNIISVMADALLLLDQKNTIVFVNNSTSALLGYDKKELDGKNIDMLFPDNLRRAQLNKIAQKDKVGNYDFILKTKSEKNIPVIFTSSAMRGASEKLIGTVCIVKDITERKKAEEELRKAYETLKETQVQLIHSEKMASIGRLAAGVAHEINNPLSVILGESQMLLKDQTKDGDTKEASKVMVEQTQRIKVIIENLLEFSRKRELKIGPADANEVVKKSLSLLQYQSRIEKIKILKNLAPKLSKISGDKGQLQQVMLNIMQNAVQAMAAGGELSITTREEEIDELGRRKTDIFKLGQHIITVEIKDTGKGIDKEALSKIFEPFFSTKEKSTGLGLSISYRIIEDHQGTIEVESQPGKGSTFIVKLPVLERGG